MTFDEWWMEMKPAECDEVKDWFEECWHKSNIEAMRDVFPAAHRLALELECLLLSCTDTVATAKWWESAHEALEQWREFCREDAEKVGAGETEKTDGHNYK